MGQGISLVYVAVNKSQLKRLPKKGSTTHTNFKEDQTYWAKEVVSSVTQKNRKVDGTHVIEVRATAATKRMLQKLYPSKPDIVGLDQPVYSINEFIKAIGSCQKAGIEAFTTNDMCSMVSNRTLLFVLLIIAFFFYLQYQHNQQMDTVSLGLGSEFSGGMTMFQTII